MADGPFINFGFLAAGASTPRTMPDRLSDIVNVKDWGAISGQDCTTAIQNAIAYCMSTTGGKAAGGTIFFPPGAYLLTQPLAVGSEDPTIGVQLVGCGPAVSVIAYGGLNFVISKGSHTYDNITTIEGLNIQNGNADTSGVVGAIKLCGVGQRVYNCWVQSMVGIDASAAVNCSIINTQGQGTDYRGAAGSTYPFPQYGVGIYLGTGCVSLATRFQGAGFVGYALSGEGAACMSPSVENTFICYRLGWAPKLTAQTNASASTGATVLQFAQSSFPSLSPLVIGRLMSGTSVPAGTTIADVNTSGSNVLVTLSAAITGDIASGATITFEQETPAVGCTLMTGQTERSPIGIDVYNARSCLLQSNFITGGAGGDTQVITNMVWDSQTHVVTVTTDGPHRLTSGGVTPMLPSFTNAAWSPYFWIWATYDSNTMADNVFTYPGPATDPGALGTNGWAFPLWTGIRVRAARECVFLNNGLHMNNTFAAIDLDYAPIVNGQLGASGQTDTNQANNVFISSQGDCGGWITPSHIPNRAGWKYIECGLTALNRSSRNTLNTISHPYGTLTFACLPGQAGVLQDGPFEEQEFDIIDGQLDPGGGAAVWNDPIKGGGSGRYKVRYGGSPLAWRRIG